MSSFAYIFDFGFFLRFQKTRYAISPFCVELVHPVGFLVEATLAEARSICQENLIASHARNRQEFNPIEDVINSVSTFEIEKSMPPVKVETESPKRCKTVVISGAGHQRQVKSENHSHKEFDVRIEFFRMPSVRTECPDYRIL